MIKISEFNQPGGQIEQTIRVHVWELLYCEIQSQFDSTKITTFHDCAALTATFFFLPISSIIHNIHFLFFICNSVQQKFLLMASARSE